MRPNTFDELPAELRPLADRKRRMRTIGRRLALGGGLLVACALGGTAVALTGLVSHAVIGDSLIATAIVGALLLCQGLVAIVVTTAM